MLDVELSDGYLCLCMFWDNDTESVVEGLIVFFGMLRVLDFEQTVCT